MLRIGIIGSGFGIYGLLPAFSSIERSQVIAVCGEKNNRLLEYCRKMGVKNIYSDWHAMLNSQNLDAIAIAVIPDIQYQIAKTAIAKGIHIFAEKPLAKTYKQAKELLDLANKNQIKHTIDFIFPQIEEWGKVKKIIDLKTYGSLKHISVNWNFQSYDIKNKIKGWKTDVSRGGGALSFYFSHSLHYLEHFAGEIVKLKSLFSYSKSSLNGGEIGVDLILKFKNNITGDAHLNCDAPGINLHQLTFVFEEATVVLENSGNITDDFVIKIYRGKKGMKVSKAKDIYRETAEDERVRIVRKLALKFVDGCLKDKQLMPSFKDGVRVSELIEKVRLARL